MTSNLISVYEATCDICYNVERLFHTRSASQKHLRKLGWKEDRHHRWTCPDCFEKSKVVRRQEVITVTETMFEGRVFTDEDRS